MIPIPLFDYTPNLCQDYQQDYYAVRNVLELYKYNAETYRVYRTQFERFLNWLWIVKDKKLCELKRIDIEDYLNFCDNPPSHWCTEQRYRRLYINTINPLWRPFVGERGITARRMTLAAISSLFAALVNTGEIARNPLSTIKQKNRFTREIQEHSVRRLSNLQLDYLLETSKIDARAEMMIACCYHMYLRISELTARKNWIPAVSHFAVDKYGNWWFTTIGKGNKKRRIAVNNHMLKVFEKYKLQCKNDLLFVNEYTGKPLSSTRHIRQIISNIFVMTVDKLIKEGYHDQAKELQCATVHWLRHTGISEAVKNGRPLEHIRDDAGHSSIQITDKYIDVLYDDRHSTCNSEK